MSRRNLAAGLAWLCFVACSGVATEPGPEVPGVEPELHRTLVRLAADALVRGDLDAAGDRYRRALEAHPSSAVARAGLGQVALRREGLEEAERWFRQALARDPLLVEALLGQASLHQRLGRPEQARDLLSRAVKLDPSGAMPHARLAALTGTGPRQDPASAGEARRLASRHPYDPRVLLASGRLLAQLGGRSEALVLLERALLVADLDLPAAREAFALLQQIDGSWQARRWVTVHLYADEGIRALPAWRFRLRLLLRWLSGYLDPVLRVRFVPARLEAFSSAGTRRDLAFIEKSFLATLQGRTPRNGVLAAFTGRPSPRRRGATRLGQAAFLGRTLLARLRPEERNSRVLAHEVLHLYGGVHVAKDVDSLMNARSDAFRAKRPVTLDALNAAIVGQLRERRFGPGSLEANVFPWIDVHATTGAYLGLIRTNLGFRKLGVSEALKRASRSRYDAALAVREARRLDAHLADVSRFAAMLLVRDDRPAEGLYLLEIAARLYGSGTPQARASRELSRRLERIHFPDRSGD